MATQHRLLVSSLIRARLFKDQHSLAHPPHQRLQQLIHPAPYRALITFTHNGSRSAGRGDRRRCRRRAARRRGHLRGRRDLRAGQLRHRPLHRLRPRVRLRPLLSLLQRSQEPQLRRQEHRRQARRMQLPQVRRRQGERPQRRQRRQHPVQVRSQHPLHHQPIRRLLQVIITNKNSCLTKRKD